MTYLLAALAAPLLGPIAYRILHERSRAFGTVDGFVYVSVPLLVAWQVLPEAWEARSVAGPVAALVGFVLPLLLERASRPLAHRTDDLAIVVGLSGIVLHAMLEGAALAPGVADPEAPFALAVVLHRIPVGLVVWWLVRPCHGVPLAMLAVASILFATVGGVALAGGLVGESHGAGVGLYQALVSGSLMHVVFHQGRHYHRHDDSCGGGHAGEHGSHHGSGRHTG